MRIQCYACAREAEVEEGLTFIRRPVGWTKDDAGRDRCPRHPQGGGGALATLGDLVAAKKRVRRNVGERRR